MADLIRIDLFYDTVFQEAYDILAKYETEMTKREAEGVYNLRHFYMKLQSKAVIIIVIFMLLGLVWFVCVCTMDFFCYLAVIFVSGS